MGERNYIATTAAFLSQALYRQGRYADAEAMTAFSEEVGAPDDVSSQFLWRCVRAKVRAREGRPAEAEALARDGLRLVRQSDDLDSQGNALMDLAEVLDVAGRTDESAACLLEAHGLFEAKGNVVSAARARSAIEMSHASTAGTA
jgi:hypothetical protein